MFFSNALMFAFFAARRHRRDHAGTVARVLQGRFLRVAVFATFAALVLVGVAGAANSISFTDPAGDSGSGSNAAPDITNVAVSSDASGTITIRVTVANRPTTLQPDDELGVDLDLDQNPDTGTVLYGTEVATVFEGSSPEFLRPDKNNTYFEQVAPPPSYLAGFANGVATLSVKASDLGLSPTGGFNVFALADNGSSGDTAPDIRTVNYQLVPGTPPPALGLDTRPPFDRAFTAHGVRGKVVHLDVISADGRGQSADTFRVYRRHHLLATHSYDLGDTIPFVTYYSPWRVPRHIRGPLRFCASSVDAAGNKSNVSCARIILR